MALLDSLIHETAEKFDLRTTQARDLVAEIVRLTTEPAEGGLRRFLNRFREAGLGESVTSWIARGGEKKPLSETQVESAVGMGLIHRLSSRLELDSSVVRSALAGIVPKLVDLLTPEGVLTETIPADLMPTPKANFAGLHVTPTGAVDPQEPIREGLRAGTQGWLGWRWGWLLPVLWCVLLAYWALSDTGDKSGATGPMAVAQPRPSMPALLALRNLAGRVEYAGVVSDENTRAGVLDALRSVLGAAQVSGTLDVDPRAASAHWLSRIKAILEQLKTPGTRLVLQGSDVRVSGWIPEFESTKLLDALSSILGPGFTYGLSDEHVSEAVTAAAGKTLAALDALKPGYSGTDLVKALNLWIVNFASDSARLPPESREVMIRAAKAIKAVPSSIIIEISGHTDNTGDAAANKALSQARAEAVRNSLIRAGVAPASLRTKGYGDDRPVASNDTPEGRFKNRRIEFSLAK
jgi:outer membrane protein OmpA-like peptidoglycan-associated protein/uncharacterized protein YidB (DUF937 family)